MLHHAVLWNFMALCAELITVPPFAVVCRWYCRDVGFLVTSRYTTDTLCVACYDPHSLHKPGCKPVAGVHGYHKTGITFSPVLPPSTS